MAAVKGMLSVSEFAKEIGRPYDTVLYWARKGLIPGTETIQETRGPVYRIPRSAVASFGEGPRRGRPPNPKPKSKRTASKK